MPRQRRSVQVLDINPEDVIDWDGFSVEPDKKEPVKPVKDYLANTHFDLLKKNEEKIECSICLDEINKCCYTMLSCGHHFHSKCIIKCTVCPLCRA